MHQGDAVTLLAERIAPASLAAVHLFFPDPWPKAKHTKRRFLAAHTLDLVADRLRPGGHLLVATDHPVYAEHARAELTGHGRFVVTEGERPAWRPLDGFEAKGLAAGRQVAELRADLLPA
jgi:tRNA (guanine-N7-)-methyltransferase